MSVKLNRYHRNYLYWIYPLIFIGLTIYAIKEDQLDEESASRTNSIVNVDSTLIMSVQTRFVDSLGITDYRDSTQIFRDLNK
jgi:hypothetical protein